MTFPHWSLVEVIDEDLLRFSRQVEFAEANFTTYSVTLLRLYLSICSEIDVIGKLLCHRIGITLPDRPNMDHYRQNLKAQYPYLWTLKITIRPMSYEVPWQEWENNKNPDWWKNHRSNTSGTNISVMLIWETFCAQPQACLYFSCTGKSRNCGRYK